MDQQPPDESPIDAQPTAAPPTDRRQPTGGQFKSGVTNLAESRGMVLAILFGVTGALGIPLLWMNKRFSLIERIFWSVVVITYTTALVGVTAAAVMWAYRTITNLY